MLDEWTSPASIPPLLPDEIQVWRVSLAEIESAFKDYSELLSKEELDRAQRRLPGRVRNEFVYGRVCLRFLLGANLGISPASVSIEIDPNGKPRTHHLPALEFNLSHSSGVVLVGMSWGVAVGVDIESINPATEIMDLAPMVFSPGELQALQSLKSEEEKRSSFFRTWARKEAIVKADGRGLSLPLTQFEVNDRPALDTAIEVTGKVYYLSDIAAAGNAVAAVASQSHNCRITMLDFPVSVLRVFL